MQYKIGEATLDNGLKLFHIAAPSDDITSIVNVNTGSLYETDSNAGISHLIEHMIFKGTKKRASRSDIYNEIALLGGKYFCYTSRSNVPLGIRAVSADFEQSLDLISNIMFHANMNKKEIEKEKKIVLDEIRNRADDPYICLWDSFSETIFEGCDLARPEIGYVETVENLTTSKVKNFYKKMFTPANATLFVVGPKSFDEVTREVEKYFGARTNGKFYDVPIFDVPENKPKKKIIEKDLDGVHLMMGRIVPASGHEDSYALSILGSALARSVSNRILNDEPISYKRWTTYHNTRFFGELMAYATCDKKNYGRVIELIQEEFLKFSKGDIPEQYVKDKILSRKKSFILGNATTMNKARECLDFWLKGNIYDINSHITNLENVTLHQVRDAGEKYIHLDDMTRVSLGNLKS